MTRGQVSIEPSGACLRLAAEGAAADIALRGAELRHWEIGGQPMIWAPDPAVWPDTAPILFPVVGWTREGQVRVGSQTYPLGLHGFARGSDFVVAERNPAAAAFVLASSPATRALYPFEFRLTVTYALEAAELAVTLAVDNTGATPMPYACGLHPGFRWPFAGGAASDYRIIFDADEVPYVPAITPAGLFAAARRHVPLVGRTLPLPHDVFAAEALCFLDAKSRGLSFGREGGPTLRIETENFRHIALWSRVAAPFLSVESWTGHGDPDGFAGDLFDKPSMAILAPGSRGTHTARYRFEPAGSPS